MSNLDPIPSVVPWHHLYLTPQTRDKCKNAPPPVYVQLAGLLKNMPELTWEQTQNHFRDCREKPTREMYEEAKKKGKTVINYKTEIADLLSVDKPSESEHGAANSMTDSTHNPG